MREEHAPAPQIIELKDLDLKFIGQGTYNVVFTISIENKTRALRLSKHLLAQNQHTQQSLIERIKAAMPNKEEHALFNAALMRASSNKICALNSAERSKRLNDRIKDVKTDIVMINVDGKPIQALLCDYIENHRPTTENEKIKKVLSVYNTERRVLLDAYVLGNIVYDEDSSLPDDKRIKALDPNEARLLIQYDQDDAESVSYGYLKNDIDRYDNTFKLLLRSKAGHANVLLVKIIKALIVLRHVRPDFCDVLGFAEADKLTLVDRLCEHYNTGFRYDPRLIAMDHATITELNKLPINVSYFENSQRLGETLRLSKLWASHKIKICQLELKQKFTREHAAILDAFLQAKLPPLIALQFISHLTDVDTSELIEDQDFKYEEVLHADGNTLFCERLYAHYEKTKKPFYQLYRHVSLYQHDIDGKPLTNSQATILETLLNTDKKLNNDSAAQWISHVSSLSDEAASFALNAGRCFYNNTQSELLKAKTFLASLTDAKRIECYFKFRRRRYSHAHAQFLAIGLQQSELDNIERYHTMSSLFSGKLLDFHMQHTNLEAKRPLNALKCHYYFEEIYTTLKRHAGDAAEKLINALRDKFIDCHSYEDNILPYGIIISRIYALYFTLTTEVIRTQEMLFKGNQLWIYFMSFQEMSLDQINLYIVITSIIAQRKKTFPYVNALILMILETKIGKQQEELFNRFYSGENAEHLLFAFQKFSAQKIEQLLTDPNDVAINSINKAFADFNEHETSTQPCGFGMFAFLVERRIKQLREKLAPLKDTQSRNPIGFFTGNTTTNDEKIALTGRIYNLVASLAYIRFAFPPINNDDPDFDLLSKYQAICENSLAQAGLAKPR